MISLNKVINEFKRAIVMSFGGERRNRRYCWTDPRARKGHQKPEQGPHNQVFTESVPHKNSGIQRMQIKTGLKELPDSLYRSALSFPWKERDNAFLGRLRDTSFGNDTANIFTGRDIKGRIGGRTGLGNDANTG